MTPAGWITVAVLISLLMAVSWGVLAHAAAARWASPPIGAHKAYVVLLAAGVAFAATFWFAYLILSVLHLLES